MKTRLAEVHAQSLTGSTTNNVWGEISRKSA